MTLRGLQFGAELGQALFDGSGSTAEPGLQLLLTAAIAGPVAVWSWFFPPGADHDGHELAVASRPLDRSGRDAELTARSQVQAVPRRSARSHLDVTRRLRRSPVARRRSAPARSPLARIGPVKSGRTA